MTSELVFEAGGTRSQLRISVSATAKSMRLRVDPRTGAVILTLPRRASRRRAVDWAAGHREWVERQLAAIPSAERLGPGSLVPLHDIPHRVDWSAERPRAIALVDGRIVAGGPVEHLEARLLAWLKRRALDLLADETRELAARCGTQASRVAVGDPLSRWGSCSSSGAIRYSWRLILAPDFVRRATVAHEVAHLVHMNHGPEFHRLVEQVLGADPKPARLWLRRRGTSLHRIGRPA